MQRLEAYQAMHEVGSPRVPPRRSFGNTRLIACLSMSVFIGALKTLGMEIPPQVTKAPDAPYLLRLGQISNIVKHELDMTLKVLHPKELMPIAPRVVEISQMINVEGEKKCEASNIFQDGPIGTVQKGAAIANNVLDWLKNYRLSAEEIKHIDPKKIDCNDNPACELLSKYGLPMYIVSVCPENVGNLLKYDWHQFAACKLNEDVFLIIDGNTSLIWHGNLEQYVTEHASNKVPSHIIPLVGISEYREPVFHNVFSKFYVQIGHIQSKDEMPPYYQPTQHSLVDSNK